MLNFLFKMTVLGSLFTSAALLTLNSASADVYRWVDEAGIVHYSDRKPKNTDSVRVKVNQQSEYRENGAQTFSERAEALEEQQEINELKAAQEKEAAVEAKALEAYCQALKANIDMLTTNPRIRTEGDDGEQRFMTPEEIVKTRKSSEQTYQEKCTP